jgi:hypothetical protein
MRARRYIQNKETNLRRLNFVQSVFSFNKGTVFAAIFVSTLALPVFSADGDLFPAKGGSLWTYKTTDWNGKVGETKCRLIDLKTSKHGESTFKIVSTSASEQKTKYYTKRGDKTLLTRVDSAGKSTSSESFTPPMLVIDTKIKTDSLWQWNSAKKDVAIPTERWQVFPIEKVKVPAGEFTCVRVGGLVSGGSKMMYQTRWFAPNVGLVKSLDNTSSGKQLEELSAYHVK